ncbi:MAG TPA: hypothetical protein VLA05_01325 [Coriobacteriia bacterium]|nr:hypothetical protein [Coriobacteriia bacterium]
MKAENIEQLSDESLRGSFGAFRAEIEDSVFDEEQRRILAEMTDVQSAWQYVLAWLTRDQECRLDGLTHWRHPESSSQPSVRNVGDAGLNVLRVVVGLYSQASNLARKEVAGASSRVEEARAVARQTEARFDALREELRAALGVDSERIWPPAVEFLQDEQAAREKHFESLMALADQKIRRTSAVSMGPTHVRNEEQLEQAAGDLARVTQRLTNLEGEVERKRERVRLLEGESAKRWSEVREAKHPVCPYDDTPLDVDKARFVCPLPRIPDPADAARAAAETDLTRKEALEDLSEDERSLTTLKGDKASLDEKVKALRRRIEANQLAVAAATSASQAAWATKGMVRRLAELRRLSDDALRAKAVAEETLRERQSQQLAGLASFSTSSLQRWFNSLLQRVLGSEATGKIVLDGNGLRPRIQWRGIRRSVALNSLQIVLFDLAAMLCAVEGSSRAPAFLVHDSPREGDLDPWTYARLFEALFEFGPDENTAPFQYIVTTTTDPPQGRVRSRVRLEISASEEQQRLFRVDL